MSVSFNYFGTLGLYIACASNFCIFSRTVEWYLLSHAAEPGFVNHQFMEGQLVVIGGGDYFSFAWVPLEHQIFFGRPSPELTLKMLREGGGASLTAGVGLEVPELTAGVKEQREYVSRCLEVTCDALWEDSTEGKIDPMSCIWHGDDDEYCYFE